MLNQLFTHIKHASLPLALKISTAFVGLFFNFVATQFLNTTEFGLFSIAQLLIITLATLGKFGLDKAIIKVVALSKFDQVNNIYTNRVVFTLMVILIIFCILLSGIFFFIGEYICATLLNKPELAALIPSISLIILPNALITFNSGILLGKQYSNLSLVLSGLATLTLTVIFTVFYTPTSALSLLNLFLLANYCICAVSLIFTFKTNLWQFKLYSPTIVSTLKSSSSLWIIAIVALLIQQFSGIVLTRYVLSNEIAIYVITTKIALLMSFFLVAINSVYSAKFAQLYQHNDILELKQLVKSIQKILLITGTLTTAFIFVYAELLLSIFGIEYQQGVLWLKILACGQFINLATGSSVNLLIMTGNEKTHRNNTLIIAIFTITLSFILIPNYHALGAAITTALAMAFQNLLSYYYSYKKVFCKQAVQ